MSLGRQHQFRSADGSGNNPHDPSLGAAGQPYGRNVTGTHPMPSSSLPAPDLVFDALLRRDGFTPHPGGISSLLFSFANIM